MCAVGTFARHTSPQALPRDAPFPGTYPRQASPWGEARPEAPLERTPKPWKNAVPVVGKAHLELRPSLSIYIESLRTAHMPR